MDTNGLSLYNVGTSLDLDALTQGGSQNNNNHHNDEDESDEGEEEEIQQRNAEVGFHFQTADTMDLSRSKIFYILKSVTGSTHKCI